MLNLQKVVHNRYEIERTDWWVGMYFFLAIMLWFFEKHLMTDLYKKKKRRKKPRTYRSINSFEKHFDDNKYSA